MNSSSIGISAFGSQRARFSFLNLNLNGLAGVVNAISIFDTKPISSLRPLAMISKIQFRL